jgi:hypothetical protein
MMVTYASAIDAVTPHESESEHFDRYLLITASVPFITRFLIQTHKSFPGLYSLYFLGKNSIESKVA